jgi:hypothetical protein
MRAPTEPIKINRRPVKALASGRPWQPRENGWGLPDRLVEKAHQDWRTITWDHPDGRTGIRPDAVSVFNGDTGTWSGTIEEEGRSYRYEMVWNRDREEVDVTFWRKRRSYGRIAIPLTFFFRRYNGVDVEPLVPGVTTIEHIEDHLDPRADVLQIEEMRAWYAEHPADPLKFASDWKAGDGWQPPDGEYRDATSQLWKAYDQLVGATEANEVQEEVNEDAERAAMVPADPPGLLIAELAALWELSGTQTRLVAKRLVAAGLLIEEEEHNPKGAPRKRYRRVDR